MASPACNKIQVTETTEREFKFKVKAYLSDSIGNVNTAQAPWSLSEEITLTTYCGPISTTIISVLASPVHKISPSGLIEIFIDENNVDGMPEWFDLKLTDMISSNPACPIIEYYLSTSATSNATYTENGSIMKPELTTLGHYTIRLRTDILISYKFFILARAHGE